MKLPDGWESALPSYTPEDKGLATRQYSQIMLNALAPVLPGLIGGSADLAPSNLTLMKMFGDFQKVGGGLGVWGGVLGGGGGGGALLGLGGGVGQWAGLACLVPWILCLSSRR
jgi:hypothetical protein